MLAEMEVDEKCSIMPFIKVHMFKECIIQTMGTKITIQVVHPNAQQLIHQAEAMLTDYEFRFSANRPDSMLQKISQNAGIQPVKVDADLYELIKIGKQHSLASGHRLNIGIGPLVKLWRIGFKDANIPSQAAIHRVLTLINPRQIQLDDQNQTVYLTKPGMEIDLGALAKGYFADKLIDFFKAHQCPSAMINLGGNLLTHGYAPSKGPGSDWRVGIQDPQKSRGHNRIILKTMDQSVVTSGVYERQLEVNGKKYHHIFDSQTGYPVDTNIESITIISKKSLDGEIWTTRLFLLEPMEIMRQVEKMPHLGAIVITKDRKVLATPNVRSQIVHVSS